METCPMEQVLGAAPRAFLGPGPASADPGPPAAPTPPLPPGGRGSLRLRVWRLDGSRARPSPHISSPVPAPQPAVHRPPESPRGALDSLTAARRAGARSSSRTRPLLPWPLSSPHPPSGPRGAAGLPSAWDPDVSLTSSAPPTSPRTPRGAVVPTLTGSVDPAGTGRWPVSGMAGGGVPQKA